MYNKGYALRNWKKVEKYQDLKKRNEKNLGCQKHILNQQAY